MHAFKSNDEFFAAFRSLVERIEKQGNAEAARELRTGFACLNGLTDGWALLMEAMDRTIAANQDKIEEQEMAELREMLRVVKKVVYRT